MKSAVIGVNVRSGWGMVVTVAGKFGPEEVLDRRRLVIIDSKVAVRPSPIIMFKPRRFMPPKRI